MTIEDIFAVNGQTGLAAYLGVNRVNLQYAKREGRFPARLYSGIRDYCREHGLGEPSDSLFNFHDRRAVER